MGEREKWKNKWRKKIEWRKKKTAMKLNKIKMKKMVERNTYKEMNEKIKTEWKKPVIKKMKKMT